MLFESYIDLQGYEDGPIKDGFKELFYEGVIDLLFEVYNEVQNTDEHINLDFKALTQAMNGMEIEAMDTT